MGIKRNLHTIDRVFRLLLGIFCTYIGFFSGLMENQIVSVLIGIFGVVNIYAFTVASCPVYAMCGISTASNQSGNTEVNESKS